MCYSIGELSFHNSKISKWCALFLLSFLSLGNVQAQGVIHLLCSGDIETIVDSRKPRSTRETVEVAAYLDDSSIEFKGEWGCALDWSNANSLPSKCSNKQPMKVSESELYFNDSSDNINYFASTSATISRYSGLLKVVTVALAKPASNAKWAMIFTSATLQCSPQRKVF
jgi:hypothetical protein